MKSFVVLVILILPALGFAQSKPCRFPDLLPFCIKNEPLKVSKIGGQVFDKEAIGIPDACVTLFDEEKNPVAFASTNEKGTFRLRTPADGRYLLVVQSLGFTVATSEMIIERSSKRPFDLVVSMEISGIDTCSRITPKEKRAN